MPQSIQGLDSSNYNGIIICIENSVDLDQLTDLDQYCFQKSIYTCKGSVRQWLIQKVVKTVTGQDLFKS